jgi:hypothetical protein
MTRRKSLSKITAAGPKWMPAVLKKPHMGKKVKEGKLHCISCRF